jgi:hypothetical protein
MKEEDKMATKFYVNDLVENEEGRLYVVYEVGAYDNLALLSIPFGNSMAWVNPKETPLKKIGNYPYLKTKLEYVEVAVEKYMESTELERLEKYNLGVDSITDAFDYYIEDEDDK